MFELKVEGIDELAKKFDAYADQLDELHQRVPDELVEWQRTDMRRRYPNVRTTERKDETAAETNIWPRSQLEQQPGFTRPARPTVKRGPRQARLKGAGRPPPSTRPILRTELFSKLVDRMTRLVREATKWP